MESRVAIREIKKVADYLAQSNAFDIKDTLYKCCEALERELDVWECFKRATTYQITKSGYGIDFEQFEAIIVGIDDGSFEIVKKYFDKEWTK